MFSSAIGRLRPPPEARQLSLALGFGFLCLCTVLAVVADNAWVPSYKVAILSGVLGYGLGLLLASRPFRAGIDWLLLLLSGLAYTILALTLPRSLQLTSSVDQTVTQAWQINLALLADQVQSWLRSVASGSASEETAAFAVFLSLAAWLLGAFLAWSIVRGRSLLGLTLTGLAMGLAAYFGNAAPHWTVLFVALAAVTAAAAGYSRLETDWTRRGLDFPADVGLELIFYALAVAMALLAAAWMTPRLSLRPLQATFQRQPGVLAAEEFLTTAFAGIAQPLRGGFAAGGTTPGTLPRKFLLGAAPALVDQVAMRASIEDAPDGNIFDLAGLHWRTASYDIYTGRGWALSPERAEELVADEAISEAGQAEIEVWQQVEWLMDSRPARYTLGLPSQIDQPVTAYWRGQEDLVRMASLGGSSQSYAVRSRIVSRDPDRLRGINMSEAPPVIIGRYGRPPDTTQRVRDLATEIVSAAGANNAYDQAAAIEAYLRQYTYSLDIPAPPENRDIVDYFLFDLQEGFCDYYASAMVVLARSLGLPARLGIGFLAQPAGESGFQEVQLRDAHSWAEIYFPGHGWVEFEPTAPFPVAQPLATVSGGEQPQTGLPYDYLTAVSAPIPIPDRQPAAISSGFGIEQVAFILAVLGLGVAALARDRRWMPASDENEIVGSFRQLQEAAGDLGYPAKSTLTPGEFAAGLRHYLAIEEPDPQRATEESWPDIETMAGLYAGHRYGGRDARASQLTSGRQWPQLKERLQQFRGRRRMARLRRLFVSNTDN